MTESTKIEFRYRRISGIRDFTQVVELLFPCNRNQQRAAACILFELKWANGVVPNLAFMEARYRLSRRTLQRTRAKLARLGLIEHVGRFNARYGGQDGWKLSGRFSASLRQLAGTVEVWQGRTESGQQDLERFLMGQV
jgi:hypothetical protein